MGSKVKDVLQVFDFTLPLAVVRSDFNILRRKWNEVEFLHRKAMFEQWNFLPIKTHNCGRHAIDGCRVGSTDEDSARFWVGRHRPIAFATDDSIHHGQVTERRLPGLPRTIEKEKAFVEIQDHPPASVISMPVSRTNNFLRVAKNASTEFFYGHKQARH
jgi:hypothetical protein